MNIRYFNIRFNTTIKYKIFINHMLLLDIVYLAHTLNKYEGRQDGTLTYKVILHMCNKQ